MRIRSVVAVIAAVLAAPTLAAGSESPGAHSSASSTQQAVIPFANLGGIYDWAADGTRGIYIQSLNRQWFYAKLFAPCIDLPFALRVGFVTEPASGAFDRFSSIVVRGQECPVSSLTKSGPPPSRDKRWRSHGNTHPAAKGDGTGHADASHEGTAR